MIKKHIVLVLGAGGSFPYEFPLGSDLMWWVIEHLGGNSDFSNNLNALGYSFAAQKAFAHQLRMSGQFSIDAFLENRGADFMHIGKASLAAALIPYENLTNLMLKDHELNEPKGRWYEYLLQLLGNRSEYIQNNLSIITYNYDRSLEYFLFNSLPFRFGLNEKEAIEFVNYIKIVHIYGQLGIPDFLDSNGRPYSKDLNPSAIKYSAEQINIIHEGINNTGVLERVHDIVEGADLLVFLGFGFQKTNIKKLGLKNYLKGPIIKKIVGTSYHLGDGEIARVKNLLQDEGVHNDAIILMPLSVLDFLKSTDYLV